VVTFAGLLVAAISALMYISPGPSAHISLGNSQGTNGMAAAEQLQSAT